MNYVGVRTQLCRCGTQPKYVGVIAEVPLGARYVLVPWYTMNKGKCGS